MEKPIIDLDKIGEEDRKERMKAQIYEEKSVLNKGLEEIRLESN